MKAISENPTIVHISWSDLVEYYMSLADIFVHPSHREGFPNVILQAGAMQLPVVCSGIPGNTDIIQNEQTGLVFAVKDEKDLYNKLNFAIANKERMVAMSRVLFDEVRQRYNRQRVHEVILENYNRLLKNHERK